MSVTPSERQSTGEDAGGQEAPQVSVSLLCQFAFIPQDVLPRPSQLSYSSVSTKEASSQVYFPTSLSHEPWLCDPVSCNGFYLLSPGQIENKCFMALGPPHLFRERSVSACMSHLLWRAVRALLRSSPRCNPNRQMDLQSNEGDKLILKANQMYSIRFCKLHKSHISSA